MARVYSPKISQGETFRLAINVTVDGVIKNLTGYSARMQVRERYNSVSPLSDLSAYVTVNNPLLGQIIIQIPSAITSALTWSKGVYDLEVYTAADADVIRVLQGEISVSPEVTR